MISPVVLILFVTAMSCMAHHINRVWTNDQGIATKALLMKVEEDQGFFQLPDGSEIQFPLSGLSKVDQAFIRKYELGVDEETRESRTEDNFDDPWPDRVKFEDDPEIETIEENADANSFIYESANYRYICDVRLANSVVKSFAVMFEATHQFVRELPLAVNGGKKKNRKYQIYLFETKAAYVKAGGPPQSAGVYIGGKNIVMVPLTSLGVRKVGSGYMRDRDKSSKTLPHELVHQLTPYAYYAPGSMGWFTEGLAEYVAATPYRYGSFNVRTNFKPIVEYVTAYGEGGTGGRALGKTIKVGPLKNYMLQSYQSFTSNANLTYGCGLLITNYFFHMDREEDGARIKKFLKALNEGKRGEEALNVLLDGQTWLELEEEIAEAYSRKRVDLIFSKQD